MLNRLIFPDRDAIRSLNPVFFPRLLFAVGRASLSPARRIDQCSRNLDDDAVKIIDLPI